jgi:hypothetical protein
VVEAATPDDPTDEEKRAIREARAEMAELEGDLAALQQHEASQKEQWANEVESLRQEADSLFCRLAQKRDDQNEDLGKLIDLNEAEFSELTDRYAHEENSLRETHNKSRETFMGEFERLRARHEEFLERARLAEALNSARAGNASALCELKQIFSEEIEKGQRQYAELVRASAHTADLQRYAQEQTALRETLDSRTRSFEHDVDEFDRETVDETEALKQSLADEISQLESGHSQSFEAQLSMEQARIAALDAALRSAFDCRESYRTHLYREEMDRITRELSATESDFPVDEIAATAERLEQELASTEIPSPPPASDIPSPAKLSAQLSRLHSSVADERAALLKIFDDEIEEEDSRHQQSLFAHIHHPHTEQLLSIDRSEVDILNDRLNRLSCELMSMRLQSPIVHYEWDPEDEEQQQLRKELDDLRDIRRQKVTQEKEVTEGMVLSCTQELEREQRAIEKENHSETTAFERECGLHEAEYEQNRLRLHNITDEATASERTVQKQHCATVASHTQHCAAGLEAIRRRIADFRRSAAETASELKAAQSQARLRLDAERARVESGAASALVEYREARLRSGRLIDAELADRTHARDRARDEFLQQSAREEEQSLLQRLGQTLDIKTQQLVALGKDLIGFRQKLITQEGEYNFRFGVDPTVALLAPKISARRRPATAIGHRLPSLSLTGTGS